MKRLNNTLAKDKKAGFTLIEGCVVGAVIGSLLIGPAIYFGVGAVGWNAVKKRVDYEDKYHLALNLADRNQDGDLDSFETADLFNEMGVVKLPAQKYSEVQPSYKALTDYIKARK